MLFVNPSGFLPAVDAMTTGTASRLRFEVIDDIARIEAVAGEWRQLLSRSEGAEPMLSPTWLLPWWRHYGQGWQPRVGLFYDAGRLVGLAPLLRRLYVYRPGIPLRRLQPWGVEAGADCVCSEYMNIIAETGHESRVLSATVDALAGGKFGPWDEFVFPAMKGDAAVPDMLCALLRGRGFLVDRKEMDTAFHIPLPHSWDAYLQGLGKKRYHLKRSLRDFYKWAGNDYALRQADSHSTLQEGMNILKALHQERWQAAGVRGAFGRPRFDAFHDAVMPRLLEEGRLQLLWLMVRNEPVAILYNIIANNKVYFYQSGRKMDVPHGQRPGTVLFALAIQKAIEAGLDEFDFLGGASQYKSQLAPATRPLLHVRAARPSLRETLRRTSRNAIALARRCWGGRS